MKIKQSDYVVKTKRGDYDVYVFLNLNERRQNWIDKYIRRIKPLPKGKMVLTMEYVDMILVKKGELKDETKE